MSKKHAGYVFIPVKPELREHLNDLKSYKSTYSSVIEMLIAEHFEKANEDYAAQNIDNTRDENG